MNIDSELASDVNHREPISNTFLAEPEYLEKFMIELLNSLTFVP